VSRHFTGVVLELTPQAEFRPRTERQTVTVRQLLGRVTGLRRSLLQIFGLALALEAFLLLTPFLMQWVVDSVLVSLDRDLLVTLGLGFGLLVLFQVATGAIRSWAVLHLSTTLNLQWLANVFAHLMRLPVAWFEKRHTGDVMSRFGAVQQIQQTLTTSFIEVVLDGLMVVLTLAMMWVYSGTLTAIALGCVALYDTATFAEIAREPMQTEQVIRSAMFANGDRAVIAFSREYLFEKPLLVRPAKTLSSAAPGGTLRMSIDFGDLVNSDRVCLPEGSGPQIATLTSSDTALVYAERRCDASGTFSGSQRTVTPASLYGVTAYGADECPPVGCT
jgi:hypothetical protein